MAVISTSGEQLQGQILGPCRIESVLGRGGMGLVYLATHVTLDIPVAVKLLPAAYTQEQDLVDRLYREARRVARLDHPNIVRVLDVNSSGDYHYIVMQFVDGPNLQDVIREKGALTPEAVAGVLAQTLEGLAWAHAAGVVHRDIKPANLMQTSAGVIKIADFGLVRDVGGETQNALTQTGQALGTPAYMPLEQWEGGDVDHRADIYSLGISGYQMLTGKLPFDDDSSPVRIIHQLVYDTRPRLEDLLPDAPADFAAVVQKMMATRVEDRFDDANQARTALQAAIVSNGWSAALPPFSVSHVTPTASARHGAATRTDANAVPLHNSGIGTRPDGPAAMRTTPGNDTSPQATIGGATQGATMPGARPARLQPLRQPVPPPPRSAAPAGGHVPSWAWMMMAVMVLGAVLIGIMLGRGGDSAGAGDGDRDDARPNRGDAAGDRLVATHKNPESLDGRDTVTTMANGEGETLKMVLPPDFETRLGEFAGVLQNRQTNLLYRFLRGIGLDDRAPGFEQLRASERLSNQLFGVLTIPPVEGVEYEAENVQENEIRITLFLRLADDDELEVDVTWEYQRRNGREGWFIDPGRVHSPRGSRGGRDDRGPGPGGGPPPPGNGPGFPPDGPFDGPPDGQRNSGR